MSDIEARVKKIIAEQLGVEESQVTSEKSFVADLGADSLDTVEDRHGAGGGVQDHRRGGQRPEHHNHPGGRRPHRQARRQEPSSAGGMRDRYDYIIHLTSYRYAWTDGR